MSRKPRILIVEDDARVMRLYSEVLEGCGYEIVQANYALPALFRAVRNPPDLILADLVMPVMNGLEMIRQFKGHEETRDIPVVVVTGSDTPEDREAALKAGCVGFLTKPIDIEAFPGQVAKFLRRSDKSRPEPPRR